MHYVRPLIHEHCDRGIRSCVRNMLCHFLHDERIADKKPHDFWRVEPGLSAENPTLIKFHEIISPFPSKPL
jgi:hypothetical protein